MQQMLDQAVLQRQHFQHQKKFQPEKNLLMLESKMHQLSHHHQPLGTKTMSIPQTHVKLMQWILKNLQVWNWCRSSRRKTNQLLWRLHEETEKIKEQGQEGQEEIQHTTSTEYSNIKQKEQGQKQAQKQAQKQGQNQVQAQKQEEIQEKLCFKELSLQI